MESRKSAPGGPALVLRGGRGDEPGERYGERSNARTSGIYREFERQLAGWAVRYAGRPDRELVRLYLLALEREQGVTVAYSENVLGPRLGAMRVTSDVRGLFRHALLSVWKDEEMHATYVRGALLKLGSPLLSARTFLQQAAGAMGGWTVAVRQHRRWWEAPFARPTASLLVWAGRLTGRVPQAVRGHLGYCSVRDFCRYNVHTEGTAWLCWWRLTELSSRLPALSGEQVDEFRRIAEDEARHRRVFKILADALTDDDRLREGVTEERLSARIVSVCGQARSP
jgi:hypothetical protein